MGWVFNKFFLAVFRIVSTGCVCFWAKPLKAAFDYFVKLSASDEQNTIFKIVFLLSKYKIVFYFVFSSTFLMYFISYFQNTFKNYFLKFKILFPKYFTQYIST